MSPIGVLAALAAGFDRMTARPVLILPPLLLDLFLWLGPRVWVSPLVRQFANLFTAPAGTDPTLSAQIDTIQKSFLVLAERFSLLTALSSMPTGVPSLMAAKLPAVSPLGTPMGLQVGNPLAAMAIWILLTVVGLGLAAFYQVAVARSVAPGADVAAGLPSWRRFVIMGLLVYVGIFVAGLATSVVASLASLILPVLGFGLAFVAVTIGFWLAIYLFFTPHGIVRYGYGVMRAVLESIQIVRWNLPSAVGFLAVAFGLTWITSLVWALPADESWFSLLAILGHAFVSATLLAASFAFYQGRHEWLQALRRAVLAQSAGDKTPPGPTA
jgi:hypothetical protein